jgi:hypothetical protein
MLEGDAGSEALVERLMEIHDHDDARLHGNSKKCDVADPNGNTEVIAEPILEDESPGHGIKPS